VTTPNSNLHLARLAQQRADQARTGSLERRAAGCAVVLLATSKTLASARKGLSDIPLADVRQATADLLDQLITTSDTTERNSP
jgi:hypothetical protein